MLLGIVLISSGISSCRECTAHRRSLKVGLIETVASDTQRQQQFTHTRAATLPYFKSVEYGKANQKAANQKAANAKELHGKKKADRIQVTTSGNGITETIFDM